jgi:hypothetical protein
MSFSKFVHFCVLHQDSSLGNQTTKLSTRRTKVHKNSISEKRSESSGQEFLIKSSTKSFLVSKFHFYFPHFIFRTKSIKNVSPARKRANELVCPFAGLFFVVPVGITCTFDAPGKLQGALLELWTYT